MSEEATVLQGRVMSVADRLLELESVVERGLDTFFEVGRALAEIRDMRLYRSTHATFKDYCEARWNFSDSRARQLIAASKTVTDVTARGLPAPHTEGEARRMAREQRAEHEDRVLDPRYTLLVSHPYSQESARKRKIAENKRERLWHALSMAAGMARVNSSEEELPTRDIHMVAAVSKPGELLQMAQRAHEAAADFRLLERRLRKVAQDIGADQNS